MLAAVSSISRCTAALACALLVAAPHGREEGEIAPGRWSRSDRPDGWHIADSQTLHVQSALPKAKTARLVEHVEEMVEVYETLLPARRMPRRLVVKLFDNESDFSAYGRRVPGVLAYTDLNVPEIVAYDGGRFLSERDIPATIRLAPTARVVINAKERDELAQLFEEITDAYIHDLAGSLAHETWHLYYDDVSNQRPVALWLDEGLAEVFGATRPSDGANLNTDALAFRRLRDVRRAVIDRTTIPLNELITRDARDFARRGELYYAMSWSLVHFLLHHDEPDKRDIITSALEAIVDGRDPVKASQAAFEDIDFSALEREWKTWVRTRPFDDPLERLAERFGDKLSAVDLDAPEDWRGMYAWYVARR